MKAMFEFNKYYNKTWWDNAFNDMWSEIYRVTINNIDYRVIAIHVHHTLQNLDIQKEVIRKCLWEKII